MNCHELNLQIEIPRVIWCSVVGCVPEAVSEWGYRPRVVWTEQSVKGMKQCVKNEAGSSPKTATFTRVNIYVAI